MRMADTSSTVPQLGAAACLVGDLVVGELAKELRSLVAIAAIPCSRSASSETRVNRRAG